MSVQRFRFVSPGVFLNEIDNSQIPQEPEAVGPAIVGRSWSGPAMVPTKVSSFSKFVNQFGNPIPGGGDSDYRNGNLAGPTYGGYAAQAHLAGGVSPVNYIRLLGVTNPSADSSETAKAGWTTFRYDSNSPVAQTHAANGGGALGLLLFPSGTTSTGTLAAVLYVTSGSIVLSGTSTVTNTAATGTNALFSFGGATNATDVKIKALVRNADSPSATTLATVEFNLNRDSKNFIRKVMNTSPILTNTVAVDSTGLSRGENVYWLGETYETQVESLATTTTYYAALVPLKLAGASGVSYHEMRFDSSYAVDSNIVEATTGWFFGQDTSTDPVTYSYNSMTKLFRLVGLDQGEWPSKSLKVSIEDIKASVNEDVYPYGTFSVVLRNITDTDNSPNVIERFDKVNLDPASSDFIAARIGDRYRKFDYTQRVNREYGQYDNQSAFVRVEMNSAVEEGLTDARLLPFGVFGPVRPIRTALTVNTTSSTTTTYVATSSFPGATDTGKILASSSVAPSLLLTFPGTRQRVSASDGGITDPTEAYFGFQTSIAATSARYDQSVPHNLRLFGTTTEQRIGISGLSATAPFEHQWVFSLDDVIATSNNSNAYYLSGSRVAGTSKTATAAAQTGSDGGYKAILAAGYDRFTAAFQGGSDGLNIQEIEPFNENRLSSQTPYSSYEMNTLEVALDLLADPEKVEMNVLTVPGVRNTRITDKMITVCENRADCMAVIDIPGGYTPRAESKSNFRARVGSSTSTISQLESRKLNTSYAATYYPWVQIRDGASQVWVPPSVVALGTFASSERKSELWFAPAGFNRGGLTQGASGLPVVNIVEKLTSKQRDDLYSANINPIASFPSEGIVIFGQKTLQVTPSALDRINVRRMMVYVKKQVSRFATQVLFDQNTQVTWSRFKALVEPFLASVQARFGLSEYKVVLDETTTTPDLIDRNILYAKIFLKPTRSIEFIAVDFVITRTGASFED